MTEKQRETKADASLDLGTWSGSCFSPLQSLPLTPEPLLVEYSKSFTMPVTKFDTAEKYRYQNGFESHLEYVKHYSDLTVTLK